MSRKIDSRKNYKRKKARLVRNNLEPSEISSAEWLSLNQFLYEVKQIDSACISVYYPYGKGQETISLLQKTKRKESLEKIELKIEKRIMDLKKNPSSAGKFVKTLCVFGWIRNGKVITKEIGTSKKLPYIYMASKRPYIKPFRDILKTNYDVLLITLDQKSARIQKFRGSQIVQEERLQIDLRARHRKGGQSQQRFLRARQTKIHVFFKKVANKVRMMDSNSELLLLGGIGPAKTEFYDEYDELVSRMTGKLIKNFDGKKLPAIIEFIPLDKDGNKTIIERIVWKFDIVINKRLFMPNYMRNLK